MQRILIETVVMSLRATTKIAWPSFRSSALDWETRQITPITLVR